jgi:UDP-N-acetylmuramate dehydrogenase
MGERVQLEAPLARYTSLRVGGPADVLVRAESVADVQLVARAARDAGVPVFVLGGGTNLLVSDRGVRGIVLVLGRGFDYVRTEEAPIDDDDVPATMVTVGAAVRVGRVVRWAVSAGLGGLEPAEGIPGTIGGGLLMNAGAYGVEIGEVVSSVSAVAADGAELHLDRAALRFEYRKAALPPGCIVTDVTLRLRRGAPAELRARMREAKRRRESSQPKGRPSAGSMFKNPPDDHAARLIEAAGLKGQRLGRVQISDKHANFFVNLGGGRAEDVKGLLDLAQRVVWERYQVWLEPEVRLVGEW